MTSKRPFRYGFRWECTDGGIHTTDRPFLHENFEDELKRLPALASAYNNDLNRFEYKKVSVLYFGETLLELTPYEIVSSDGTITYKCDVKVPAYSKYYKVDSTDRDLWQKIVGPLVDLADQGKLPAPPEEAPAVTPTSSPPITLEEIVLNKLNLARKTFEGTSDPIFQARVEVLEELLEAFEDTKKERSE